MTELGILKSRYSTLMLHIESKSALRAIGELFDEIKERDDKIRSVQNEKVRVVVEYKDPNEEFNFSGGA